MPESRSVFTVTGWDEEPYLDREAGPRLARTTVKKVFSGDLEGSSEAELLMCQSDANDINAGAGYVASEQFEGAFLGKKGSFVMQHGGLVSGEGTERTFGNIVPGSGTEQLTGLSGTVEISVDADGTHRIAIQYELP